MDDQKEKEYKNLIAAQKEYRKECIESLKNEIAENLTPEFDDFFESLDFPMSDMLGEIYKEKLLKISKILNNYNINVKTGGRENEKRKIHGRLSRK